MLPFLVPSGCVAAEARGGARAAFQSFLRSHVNLGKKTRLVDMIDMFFFFWGGGRYAFFLTLWASPIMEKRCADEHIVLQSLQSQSTLMCQTMYQLLPAQFHDVETCAVISFFCYIYILHILLSKKGLLYKSNLFTLHSRSSSEICIVLICIDWWWHLFYQTNDDLHRTPLGPTA